PTARQQAVRSGNFRHHLGIRPLMLEMDIVNQCNLRCVMCHFSSPEFSKKKKQEMSLENFRRITEQVFPLCARLSLSISTEPKVCSQLRVMVVSFHGNGASL
nr:hypothetical protein [bacterium]